MTKEEFIAIMEKPKAIYTQQNFLAKRETLDIWYSLFQDFPAKAMAMAVQSYILTKTFPPTPADINAELQKLRIGNAGSLPTAEEAFAMVRKATRNSTYNSEFEFSKLPKIVQDAVGVPQNLMAWGAMDSSEFETVQKSHFVRQYNSLVARAKDEERLPGMIRNVIEKSRENPGIESFKHPQIEEKTVPQIEEMPEIEKEEGGFTDELFKRFGTTAPKPEEDDDE